MDEWKCPNCGTENESPVCTKCGNAKRELKKVKLEIKTSETESDNTAHTSNESMPKDEKKNLPLYNLIDGLQNLIDLVEDGDSMETKDEEASEESIKYEGIISAICNDLDKLTERVKKLRIRLEKVVTQAHDENREKKLEKEEIKGMIKDELVEFLKRDLK